MKWAQAPGVTASSAPSSCDEEEGVDGDSERASRERGRDIKQE
jgi:hypothetical protein